MKIRNAFDFYTIIDGHKGAFRLHPLRDSLGDAADIDK